MIDKQELRIGNWVEYGGYQYQIACLADDYPHLNTTEFGHGVVDYYNLEGIPLLLEHLQESASLEHDSENNWFVSKHDQDLTIEPYTDDMAVYIGGKLIRIVEDLHRLQNLYFELTDNELEIEL